MPFIQVFYQPAFGPDPENSYGTELLQFCRKLPDNLARNAETYGFSTSLTKAGTELVFVPYGRYDISESDIHFRVEFEEALSEHLQLDLRDALATQTHQAFGRLIVWPSSLKLSVDAGNRHGAFINDRGIIDTW